MPTTIDIHDGYNNKYNNFCSYTTFTKASPSSYLREARYFNNNFGVLALLANVYDLSFKIQTKKMNTCFYPGNIINFIVTDFGPSAFIDPARTPLGESDPHTANTRANILGYGGYYIITKVSYLLEDVQSVGSATISITCKFLGTDANLNIAKGSAVEDIFINEPKVCVDLYNDQLGKLRTIDPDIASGFTVGVTRNVSAAPLNSLPAVSSLPQAQRLSTGAPNVQKSDLFLAASQFVTKASNRVAGATVRYEINDVIIDVRAEGFIKSGIALANYTGVISPTPITGTVKNNIVLSVSSADGRSLRIDFPI